MSALLTTTMPKMQECIEYLKEKNMRDKYIVMVGELRSIRVSASRSVQIIIHRMRHPVQTWQNRLLWQNTIKKNLTTEK